MFCSYSTLPNKLARFTLWCAKNIFLNWASFHFLEALLSINWVDNNKKYENLIKIYAIPL